MNLRPIREFAKVRRGASPRPIDDARYFGGDVGWVRISDVTSSHKYLRKTAQYLSPLGESMSVRVNPGDLVLSICATVGRPMLIDMPACIHDGFVLIDDLKETDAEFLYYQLQANEARLRGSGQSGTQTNLNTKIVENLHIYIPQKAEQLAIARVLATVDRAIEETESLLTKHERIKAGLMHDLLTRGLDADGRLRDPSKHKFKSSGLGPIPTEWTVVPLRETTLKEKRITYGIVQPGEFCPDGVLLIRGQDYIKGWASEEEFFRVSPTLHSAFERSTTRAGDILLCIVGATTGAVSEVPSWISEANITQTTARISCDPKKMHSPYCRFVLESEIGQRQIRAFVKGSAQPGLNLADVAEIIVPMPSVSEQSMTASVLQQASDLAETDAVNLGKLRRLKASLMQDLLAGRVSVAPLLQAAASA